MHFDNHISDKESESTEIHPDDLAVDRFATAMKEKLALAREKGRSGWEQCDPAELTRMLVEHVGKGDPRDVANFCMFLWSLGQPINPNQPAPEQKPIAFCVEYTEESGRKMLGNPTLHISEAEQIAGLIPSRRNVVELCRCRPEPAPDVRELVEAANKAAEVCEVFAKLFKQVESMKDGNMPDAVDCQITVHDLRKGLYAAADLKAALAKHGSTP